MKDSDRLETGNKRNEVHACHSLLAWEGVFGPWHKEQEPSQSPVVSLSWEDKAESLQKPRCPKYVRRYLRRENFMERELYR